MCEKKKPAEGETASKKTELAITKKKPPRALASLQRYGCKFLDALLHDS
jgi:hypothetical protein